MKNLFEIGEELVRSLSQRFKSAFNAFEGLQLRCSEKSSNDFKNFNEGKIKTTFKGRLLVKINKIK